MDQDKQMEKRVQSVELAFSILKILAEHKREMSLNELAQATSLHKSQLYRYLNSFVQLGVLIKSDEKTPNWSLGPELISLGNAALDSLVVSRVSTPFLIQLRNTLNETVALSIWGERGPLFIRKERANKPITVNLNASYIPLYTATGMVFRAFLPQEWTEPYYVQEIESGLIQPDAFDKQIRAIRDTKLSIIQDMFMPGISAVSTPIFYSSAELAGAVSVIGVTGSIDISPQSHTNQELLKTACMISKSLGYTADHE